MEIYEKTSGVTNLRSGSCIQGLSGLQDSELRVSRGIEVTVKAPVLNCFSEVLRPDPLGASQVSDCPGDFQDAAICATR